MKTPRGYGPFVSMGSGLYERTDESVNQVVKGSEGGPGKQ
jgi:hypothetical protein